MLSVLLRFTDSDYPFGIFKSSYNRRIFNRVRLQKNSPRRILFLLLFHEIDMNKKSIYIFCNHDTETERIESLNVAKVYVQHTTFLLPQLACSKLHLTIQCKINRTYIYHILYNNQSLAIKYITCLINIVYRLERDD